MELGDFWERQAEDWVRWAREPDHDSYWLFHRDRFLDLLPPPGRLTVDVGCGEGRLSRHLQELGHTVVAVDRSPTMIRYAREADPGLDVCAAIVHPLNTAGAFTSRDDDAPFVIGGSYFEHTLKELPVERDGLRMTFLDEHRPLEDYFRGPGRGGSRGRAAARDRRYLGR